MNLPAGFLIYFFVLVLAACKPAQKTGMNEMKKNTSGINAALSSGGKSILENILAHDSPYLQKILENPEYRVQIIYTRIDRNKNNIPSFTDYFFHATDDYFYPASTVKLPVAILALQKLNELALPGLDKNTTMITESDDEEHSIVYNDPTGVDGRPTIANYIKKILLVSDNDAFNRLYEFLGQEYINRSLYQMGYEEAQIIHRLNISMTENQNRYTNPVHFFDHNGKLIYTKPSELSSLVYASRHTLMGKGYFKEGRLISEPFDFSKKNRLSLYSLHQIVRSILFPEQMPPQKRFYLKPEDYAFLRKYMSMTPLESDVPAYPPQEYYDNYVKFLFYGAEKNAPDSNIRIFNKVGDAYGFLIDAAYLADFKNKIEFQLSAVIYCNSDGIFNDDHYDYDLIGFPFMKRLGQVIYQQELQRKRKNPPDLHSIQFNYRN